MMKISTSLIKIRYAVGVMLALSAVFAVVIGTSTLQPRDATAQSKPTLSISVSGTDFAENNTPNSFTVTVTASAVATDQTYDVEVGVVGDDSLGLVSSRTVTVPVIAANAEEAARRGTGTIGWTNDGNTASGKRVITVSLPESHPNFIIGSPNTATVTIHDDENSTATGKPIIRLVQDPGTNDENVRDNTPLDDDDNDFSLGTTTITEVTENDLLVADLKGIKDLDGLTDADGTDGNLGAVEADGYVSVTDSTGGTLSNPDDVAVTYQWVRIIGKDDDDAGNTEDNDVDISTNASYTVVAGDIGNEIKVEVTIQDDATQATINPNRTVTEIVSSPSVDAPATLSISLPTGGDHVAENNTDSNDAQGVTAPSFIFNVTSDGTGNFPNALSFKVKVSGASHLDLPNEVDVNIPTGQSRGADNPVSTYVGFSNRNGAQGKQTVTLTLPSSVAGYRISDDNSVKVVTIHDDENSKMTGPLYVVALDPVSKVVQVAGKGTTKTTDDKYRRYGTVHHGGHVASGTQLAANLTDLRDADGLTLAAGDNKFLGIVEWDGERDSVLTDSDGAVSASDDQNVTYQWKTVDGFKDDDPNRPIGDPEDDPLSGNGANGPAYTVQDDDIGKEIYFTVTISDDATQASIAPNRTVTEVDHSPAVFVPPTLSIAATGATEILEGGRIQFTVSSNVALSADQDVTVSIDTSKAPGVALKTSEKVTIDISADDDAVDSVAAQDTTSNTNGDDNKEGKQTVVVSLPSSLDGFYISKTANSVTYTVHDTANTDATGTPGIREVQVPGTGAANVVIDDKGTTTGNNPTDDDTYSLSTYPVPTGGVSSGTILVADLNGLVDDADGLDKADGPDDVLGAVFGSDKRVSTTSAGVVLTGTGLDDSQVSYQWKTVVGNLDDADNGETDDTPLSGNGAQGSAYTVQDADIGKTIYVVASFRDDADDDHTVGGLIDKTDPESRSSAGVSVTPTLTVIATANVKESTGTFTVTVTSDADVAKKVTVPVTLDLEGPTSVMLPTSVDVTIDPATSATVGSQVVTFKPVSGAQGKGTVTASLKTPVTGYILDSATAKTTIHDDVNSDARGIPEILEVGSAGTPTDADAYVVPNGDGTYSLGSYSPNSFGTWAGKTLVASLNRVADNDGLDKANGADNVLGAVNSQWRVATTDAGVVLTGTGGNGITALDDSVVSYQWKTVVGNLDDADNGETDDIDLSGNGAGGSAYTVQSTDIGKTIYVVVTFADDADTGQTPAGPIDKNNESIISAGVDVNRAVYFSYPATEAVYEGATINVSLRLTDAPRRKRLNSASGN